MLVIQNDTVDMMARDTMPIIAKLAEKMFPSLDKKKAQEAEQAFNRLVSWYGQMSEDSIGASVYAVWQVKFYNTLFS